MAWSTPNWDELTDEELIETLNPIMHSIINANYYRILSQMSLHVPITVVERYIKANETLGPWYGKLIPVYHGKKFIPGIGRATLHVNLWKNCDVSRGKGMKFDTWVWGLDKGKYRDKYGNIVYPKSNTIFTRKLWWTCYLLRAPLEKRLKLKPGTLGRYW